MYVSHEHKCMPLATGYTTRRRMHTLRGIHLCSCDTYILARDPRLEIGCKNPVFLNLQNSKIWFFLVFYLSAKFYANYIKLHPLIMV